MDSVRLVHEIVQCFHDVGLCGSKPQLENLALLCYALAVGRDCHLANLALELPLAGLRTSLAQRLRRNLQNEHFAVRTCYAPLGRQFLAHWSGAEICLVLDRTDIKDEVSLLLLGAAYHKRLLPLTWQVLRFGGTGAAEPSRLCSRCSPGCRRRCGYVSMRTVSSARSKCSVGANNSTGIGRSGCTTTCCSRPRPAIGNR